MADKKKKKKEDDYWTAKGKLQDESKKKALKRHYEYTKAQHEDKAGVGSGIFQALAQKEEDEAVRIAKEKRKDRERFGKLKKTLSKKKGSK